MCVVRSYSGFILCLHYIVFQWLREEPGVKKQKQKNSRLSSFPPKIKPTRML